MANATDLGPFLTRYFEELFARISLTRNLTEKEKASIQKSVLARLSPMPVTVNNNYKHTYMETDTKKILDILFGKKLPTMTGYGVVYKDSVNVPGKILEHLIRERKVKKKLMLAHANDEDKTIHDQLDVEQKVIKVLANAYYGATGVQAFHFFNPYVGPSVTYSGQMIIMSAVLGFEAMMTDNFFFDSVDEVIKYVHNIVSEVREEDASISDEEITADMLAERLLSKCSFEASEEQMEIIAELVSTLDEHDLERVYLKNNLFAFLNTEVVSDIFFNCFDMEYIDPMSPPESVKENIQALNMLADYFLYYPYQWERKDKRVQTMKRRCVLISDTDSSFLNIDPVVTWFETKFNDGERLDKVGRIVVCNAMVYLITKFVDRVFGCLTKNLNVREDRRPLINMKSELVNSSFHG